MGSQSKVVRIRQKETVEQNLSGRLAALATKGVTGEAAEKDALVRHLRADLKTHRKQIAVIDGQENLKRSLAEHKAAKAATPKVKGSKKKAAAEEPAAKTPKKAKAKKAEAAQSEE